MNTNTIEPNVENVEVVEKPYEFRELCAKDIPLMTNVIKAIGLKEFKSCLKEDVIGDIVKKFTKQDKPETGDEKPETGDEKPETGDENNLVALGISVLPTALDIGEIILDNIDKCETALIKLLSKTSNLDVKQVEELSLANFAEMIFDFVKKDEFPDFFKVVSKFFKSVN